MSLLLLALAAATPAPVAEQQALDIAKRAIAFRSVAGPGNQTPQLDAYIKSVLVAGGFADGDVTITPVDDTAYLIARWHGSDPKAKPLVISGHLDVVEAKPAEWQRDPFTPVVIVGRTLDAQKRALEEEGAAQTLMSSRIGRPKPWGSMIAIPWLNVSRSGQAASWERPAGAARHLWRRWELLKLEAALPDARRTAGIAWVGGGH